MSSIRSSVSGGLKTNHSQVEAKILLLLKEVVQDILPDKVWVQGVVYHLGPAKLQNMRGNRGRNNTRMRLPTEKDQNTIEINNEINTRKK